MNNGHLGHIDSSIGIEFIWYLGEKPADFWGYPSFRQTRFCVNSWTPWNAQHGHHFFFAVPNFETYPNATIDPRSVMPMGHFPVGCPSDNQDAPPPQKKKHHWIEIGVWLIRYISTSLMGPYHQYGTHYWWIITEDPTPKNCFFLGGSSISGGCDKSPIYHPWMTRLGRSANGRSIRSSLAHLGTWSNKTGG